MGSRLARVSFAVVLVLVLGACPPPGSTPGPGGPGSGSGTPPPPPSGPPIATADWYAWVNLMPPGPASLHVTGTVELPSPGYDVELRVAPSVAPDELVLDLVVTEKPGVWPQVISPAPVRYDQPAYAGSLVRVVVREPDGDRTDLVIEKAY